MSKIIIFFLTLIGTFSVSAQSFFVGDTTCNYFKPNYTFTATTTIGHSVSYYDIDLDGDNISDISPSCERSIYPAVPSQHGPIDIMSLSFYSTSNVIYIYAPSTSSLCLYSNIIKNMPYGSAIPPASNWTLTGSPIVYNMDDVSTFPITRCGINTNTFYVAFKKIMGNNDTIFGWLLLDTQIPNKLISYAYRHSSSISSSFSVAQDSVCLGDSLNLNSIGSGYFSGVGVKNNYFHSTAAGNYQVYASNGCANTHTLDITVFALPSPQITNSSTPICQGDSLVLSGVPVNGLFSGSGVNNGVFYSSSITTNTVSINYAVSDQHGCSNNSSKTFSITPLTYTMSACIGSTFCLPMWISLDTIFSGIGIFNNYYFDSNISGVGNIPITFTSLCNKTATLNITVNPNPPTPQITNSITKCCLGDKIPMTASPTGGAFQSTTSQLVLVENDTLFTQYFFQDLLFGDSGRVVIEYGFSDNNGCTSFAHDTILVEYAYSPNNPINSCPNTTFSLTGFPTGGTFSGVNISGNAYTAPSSIGYDYGYYNYTYPSGCHTTYTLNLSTYDCVGIEEQVFSDSGILVYPNPSSDYINIKVDNFNVEKKYSVSILSPEGKCLRFQNLEGNQNQISVEGFSNGIYFIEFNIDNINYRNKLVIIK